MHYLHANFFLSYVNDLCIHPRLCLRQNRLDKPVCFTHVNVLLSYVTNTMSLLGNVPFLKIYVNCFMARDDSPGASVICKCMWVRGLVPVSFLGHLLSLIQFSSVARSCLTLCDPTDCSMPGLPVHHQVPEFIQSHVHWVGDAIQLSHPLLSPSLPTLNLSQHQGLFQWVSSSHQVAKVLEFELQHHSFQSMNIQDWSPLGWNGWISLQSKGFSKVFSSTIVQKHQFFGAQLSL